MKTFWEHSDKTFNTIVRLSSSFFLVGSVWPAVGFLQIESPQPLLPPTFTSGEMCSHKSQKLRDIAPKLHASHATPPQPVPPPCSAQAWAGTQGLALRQREWPHSLTAPPVILLSAHFSFLFSCVNFSHSHYLRSISLTFTTNNRSFKKKETSHLPSWVFKTIIVGLPWWSSGWDSVLPLQGAWVRSLVRELRSCMPWGQKI